jgi:hypothetical protein
MNIYDEAEKEEASLEVYQDDYHSGDDNITLHNIQGGEATVIEGNLQEFIRNKRQAAIIDEDREDKEEDDTVLQYFSDDGNVNNDDMSPGSEDEDF